MFRASSMSLHTSMSHVLKLASRLSAAARISVALACGPSTVGAKVATGTFCQMAGRPTSFYFSRRWSHSRAEKELSEFLSDEIVAEQKLRTATSLPARLGDFEVKVDGSEVTLTKNANSETVTISFNVNHSVDADTEVEAEAEKSDIKSRPSFEVDIKRANTTLSFGCSFVGSASAQDDIFAIDEVTMFQGDWKESSYAVSGDVLDGYLYDLLMNLLEEKGVSNEFVDQLSQFSSAYEHNSYIALLENLRHFCSTCK